MREVVLSVRHHGEPESDVSARYPDLTLRSLSSMTGSAAERKRIIEISGNPDSIPAFLEEFRAAEAVVAAEPLSPLGESSVYVALTYNAHEWDSISERLTRMGIHYRTGTTITAGWERWTLYLEADDDLRAIIRSLEAAGNETELVREVPLSELNATGQLAIARCIHTLTPRQREVLATAIDRGYYRLNKGTSIEDIADAVDLAPSTAWEHLVRAEHKVMDEIGGYLVA